MKHLIYSIMAFASAAMTFTSCSGGDETCRYIESLERQLAAIDTIDTREAYVARIDSIRTVNAGFAALGIELDDAGKTRVKNLSDSLQLAIDNKYRQLMTPSVH